MQFEFYTADRILFGPGTLSQVAPAAAEMGDRVLLVVGRNADRSAPLIDALKSRGVGPEAFPDIISRSRRASSMKGNPASLSDAELTLILERAVVAS